MRKLYITLSLLCGLGLLSMTSTEAEAQCTNSSNIIGCPVGVADGSDFQFELDGVSTFFNNTLNREFQSIGAIGFEPSNTETGRGLHSIGNAYPGGGTVADVWDWWLFGGGSPSDEPQSLYQEISTTPTAPDPSAARYRVKFTMFPFPKISIDGSTVDKSLGKRTIRIKLPSGKFVTEEITIMQTEDGKIYGVGAGLHNFGPMHESRNQPFPGQTQYSFDEDPIPRPAPTPGSQMSETDQQNMEQGPSSGENLYHFQCNHISTPHPGDEICILSLRQD